MALRRRIRDRGGDEHGARRVRATLRAATVGREAARRRAGGRAQVVAAPGRPTKTITVRLHATLRKHLPPDAKGTAVLDLPDGATVGDLVARLGIPNGHAGIMVCGAEHLEIAAVLRDGQEVDLFPPLAGGTGRNEEAR